MVVVCSIVVYVGSTYIAPFICLLRLSCHIEGGKEGAYKIVRSCSKNFDFSWCNFFDSGHIYMLT